jgi:hypothetical protein
VTAAGRSLFDPWVILDISMDWRWNMPRGRPWNAHGMSLAPRLIVFGWCWLFFFLCWFGVFSWEAIKVGVEFFSNFRGLKWTRLDVTVVNVVFEDLDVKIVTFLD